MGEGLMLLIKEWVKHSLFTPLDLENPRTEKERSWEMLHAGESRIAVEFVHMAAQVPNNDEFKVWNNRMYYYDNEQIRLRNMLSSPLWFTWGVKQGSTLSGPLFALYIAGLGMKLQEMKLGGGVLTGMFHAAVLRIQIRWIHKIFGFLDPDPDPQKYADPRGKISTKNCKKKLFYS